MFLGFTWILIFFALPETLRVRRGSVERAAEDALQDDSGAPLQPTLCRPSIWEKVVIRMKKLALMARFLFVDPLKIMHWLRFPAVALTVYYSAVTFGILYALNVSLQATFQRAPYHFSTLAVGGLYVPSSLGYFITSWAGGRWSDKVMRREAVKANRVGADGKLVYRPEDRMRENAWFAAVLYPTALIWYGWTAQVGVFWAVPVSFASSEDLAKIITDT